MNKKASSKYDTEGMDEGEFEPGSHNRVLKNLLHLRSKKASDEAEWRALESTQAIILDRYSKSHRFTSSDFRKIHKIWLGNIYKWAGSYRNVNLSKNGFPFAASNLIPNLMKKFEKNELKKFTPCNFKNEEDVIEAISIVHCEFIIIHPFREGNGRIGRLLSGLMAMQADLPMLDYTYMTGKHRKNYISAIHTAVDKNYEPMKSVFRSIIQKTLKKLSE